MTLTLLTLCLSESLSFEMGVSVLWLTECETVSLFLFFHLIILDIHWGAVATHLGVKYCVVQSAVLKVLLRCLWNYIPAFVSSRERDHTTKDNNNDFI